MAEEEKKKEETTEESSVQEEKTGAETSKQEVKEEKPEADDNDVEVPEKFKKLVEEIENMPVLELHELVKVFEAKFGVSAQAVAAPAAAQGGGEGAEEQDAFTVELTAAGDQKIAVIKAVKEILGLGLKEAKDMVDGAPTVLKEGVKKEEAEEIKKKIEEASGSVALK